MSRDGFEVLVVCTGTIARSPMAQRLLRVVDGHQCGGGPDDLVDVIAPALLAAEDAARS
jgi:hypothetical protein